MHGLIFETSVWLLAGSTRLISFNKSDEKLIQQFPTSAHTSSQLRIRTNPNTKPKTKHTLLFSFVVSHSYLFLRKTKTQLTFSPLISGVFDPFLFVHIPITHYLPTPCTLSQSLSHIHVLSQSTFHSRFKRIAVCKHHVIDHIHTLRLLYSFSSFSTRMYQTTYQSMSLQDIPECMQINLHGACFQPLRSRCLMYQKNGHASKTEKKKRYQHK